MAKKKHKKGHSSVKWRLFAILIMFVLAFFVVCSAYTRSLPLRIGVLLNLSGSDSLPYRKVLEWAREKSGRKIELVYVDTAQFSDAKKSAESLLNDNSISVVIGPDSSDQAMVLAPLFIARKKLLISPTATSADLYRAFAGKNYFWRTVESDVAQVHIIMEVLMQKKVKKIALIYDNTSYGKTYFDWTGFYATENGIQVTSIQALNPLPDYRNLVNDALKDNPDYIICAVTSEEAVALKKQLDMHVTRTRLFLTDNAETEYVIKNLGIAAEGLESSRPAADPDSGFDKAFRNHYQMIPPPYMATTYDAFMLAATALARQEYIHKYTLITLPFMENISDSLKKILYHQTEEKDYQWNEMMQALESIANGHTPNLRGASGKLVYDLAKGVDPTSTFYAYSKVINGNFIKQQTIGSAGGDVSAADSRASAELATLSGKTNDISFAARKDFQAVIVATSRGWQNYRHQSDALAVYQALKKNGVSDDKISLAMYGDIAVDPKNNPKNSLYHIENGPNNVQGAQVDFIGSKNTLANFKNNLLNLNSNANTDLLLYIVDHGGAFGGNDNAGGETGGDLTQKMGMIPFATGDILTSYDLAKIINEMKAQNKFRKMLIVVESCYGGAMGQEIMTPGVIFLSGASGQEVSYGANYDSKIDQWLADSFTHQFLQELEANPKESIFDFYQNVYKNVAGSHVTLENYQNFGGLKTSISQFFSP